MKRMPKHIFRKADQELRISGDKGTMPETQVRKADYILIALLAVLSVCLLIIPSVTSVKPDSPALLIQVNGKEYGEYPLAADREIKINDTNTCQISDGNVTMTYADCPDQICVHERAIDENGGNIVCLPNKVVLSIVNQKEAEGGGLDGVSR